MRKGWSAVGYVLMGLGAVIAVVGAGLSCTGPGTSDFTAQGLGDIVPVGHKFIPPVLADDGSYSVDLGGAK